ncbi:hypothetical protein RIR_jg40490.t1 [Rhizophagus irregularis DAOM 181602=DAOM 197198]|nr:hypothetical protein RIR_jg40490.t1 [Rhizophagus irregularis DAOM 181602=DAOM 197198]
MQVLNRGCVSHNSFIIIYKSNSFTIFFCTLITLIAIYSIYSYNRVVLHAEGLKKLQFILIRYNNRVVLHAEGLKITKLIEKVF